MKIQDMTIIVDDFSRFDCEAAHKRVWLNITSHNERVPMMSLLMDVGKLRELVDVLQQADQEMKGARDASEA